MSKITRESQRVILLVICLGCSSPHKVSSLTNYPEFEDRPSTNLTLYSLNEQDCPQTSYKFPDVDQTTNYLRLQTAVPDLEEFTICGWYTLFNYRWYHQWFSYANDNSPQAFGIQISVDYAFIYLNGLMIPEYHSLEINKEYHICFAIFASSTGQSYMFIDGQLADVFQGNPGVIEGGGVAIMGMLQQSYGEDFDPNYSAKGKMSNFMFWNRVLTFDEISNMYINPCFCAPDYLFTAETKNIDMFGAVSALSTQTCPDE